MSQATQSRAKRPCRLREPCTQPPALKGALPCFPSAPMPTRSPLHGPDFHMHKKGFLRLSPRHALVRTTVPLPPASSCALELYHRVHDPLALCEGRLLASVLSFWTKTMHTPGHSSLPASELHRAPGVGYGQPLFRGVATKELWPRLWGREGWVTCLLSEPEKSLLLLLVGQSKMFSLALGGPPCHPLLIGARAFVPTQRKGQEAAELHFPLSLPCVSEDESFSFLSCLPASLPPPSPVSHRIWGGTAAQPGCLGLSVRGGLPGSSAGHASPVLGLWALGLSLFYLIF